MKFKATLLFLGLGLASCSKNAQPPAPDRPRLTPAVKMVDVTFHSAALNRDMPYRAIIPATIAANQKLPVLYLLHGGGGGFRDWSNYSDVAGYAEHRLILIMPEGNSSYYTNSADRPQDRYEDYIVRDLIADVEQRFPAAGDRTHRATAGVSMGGFGAVALALKHPDLFVFAGGLSSALDVPSRPFSIKRVGNTGSTAPSSVHGEARTAGPVIRLSSCAPLIRLKLRTYFLPVAIWKVCCPPIIGSPPYCRHGISVTSSTLFLVAMIGTSGIAMFLI